MGGGKHAFVRIPTSVSLILLFLLAVLLPSVILSMLALRAADREALHVEGRLESALMSEVNMTASRIVDLMRVIEEELVGEASEIPANPSLFSRWSGGGSLSECPFLLVDDQLFLPALNAARDRLQSLFGRFLQGRGEIPFYDSIDGVYRREPNNSSEPSSMVARSKGFDEIREELQAGVLPWLSEEGMELFFWSERMDGTVAGFLLNPGAVRERIVDVLPVVLNETRILTVLDERGEPLAVPAIPEMPDWHLPYLKREIAPVLPGWEVGVWLTDPSAAADRARSAARAVWMLVGVLFFVIAAGGALILWMMTSEMRLARRKTTFVANLSHELKTPLTSIRLFAEMLLSGRQRDEERRREYLRTMVSEAERLSRLVENVLASSRDGGRKRGSSGEPLDLAELAGETLSQMAPGLSRSGLEFSFSSEGRCQVTGDPGELRQVLMNLLSNAEKYSSDGREIRVVCRSERGCAIVEVLDRGAGIPSSQQGRIFQEFFRGDNSLTASSSGAGLGLSIARSIARRHGGDVTYSPREGGGSVFSLSLPLCYDNDATQGVEE